MTLAHIYETLFVVMAAFAAWGFKMKYKKTPFIPVGKVCPKADTCPIKKKGQCNHQGVKHQVRFECYFLGEKK